MAGSGCEREYNFTLASCVNLNNQIESDNEKKKLVLVKIKIF